MSFFLRIRDSLVHAVRFVTRRASTRLHLRGKNSSPIANRLLSDALRLAEIPSPTNNEEQRAAFILERLSSLGLTPLVDEEGNVSAKIACGADDADSPILVFANLSSPRWHPLESLSRLDPTHAYGAGLADALSTAMLLSIAESSVMKLMKCGRDIHLLFAAQAIDSPGSTVLRRLSEDARDHPVAAIGLRGLPLGGVSSQPLGTYRIEVRIRTDSDIQEAALKPGSAVDAVVELARTLSGITWDAENMTTCRIRRIEAGSGFGKNPTEGILDIELESSSGPVLELAMKAAVATAESKAREAKALATVDIVGFVPVGDPSVNAGLLKLVTQAMRDQRIKVQQEPGADPASFLSSMGIPAVSLGVAKGREGLRQDEIDIASIEQGSLLLVSIIEALAEGTA
ncbi:MAG: hypothetical protein JXM71_07400 [Spirochaetales bacterium]|nr:hypothetical protein [Spirochaetales bacterium]